MACQSLFVISAITHTKGEKEELEEDSKKRETEENRGEKRKKENASRNHTYIILTPLNPTLYIKTGVYKSIHYFSYFCLKT